MTTSAEFTGTRQAAVAGQFYPASAGKLRDFLDKALNAPAPPLPGRVRALIVPHAGYVYSGSTAATAYAHLRDLRGVTRVVVLAPSHRVGFRGISVGPYAAFATPLGSVPVDVDACRKLAGAHPLFSARADAHRDEHALEVQLPFLQRVAPNLKLVPLVCGQLTAEDVRAAAPTLRELLWNPETVWVVSSDFTHFGADFGYLPFTRDVPRRLKELDQGAIDQICKVDADGFMRYVDSTGATICGHVPIALLLAVAREPAGAMRATALAYTTSGQLTHDWDHTVSYAAIALTDAAPAGVAAAAKDDFTLTDADKTFLLKLARQAIVSSLHDTKMAPVDETALPAALKANGACFVTLTEKTGALRGCIGHLEASEPLWRNVVRNARNAAFHDPRFFPLTLAEYPNLNVEISVLTPARKIASLEEFVIGKHGIILEKGRSSAVFLPQVAPEQGWDRDTTLNHLALKAGLPQDAWRQGATFHTFEAIVFHEPHPAK